MQDFQSITGQSRRIFAGATDGTAGGWDIRRLSSFPSTAMAASPHLIPPPPLKCPRCDSQNTKFCYYNNYNLSQPRHFCKSCRRYWTKGGVLRNVPVGGGCRKPKRSSHPKSRRSTADPSSSNPNPNPNPNPSLDPILAQAEIFPDAAGSFSNLLAPHADDRSMQGFEFVDPVLLRLPDLHQKVEEIPAEVIIDQMMVSGRGEGAAIEWPPAVDSGIYELAGGGDPAGYWSQSQWGEADPSVYLP